MTPLSPPRDLLMSLATCSDGRLFIIVVSVRVAFVLYTLICVHVLPWLFLQSSKFFMFDSGELLYDDPRFTGMRNWDGVHFFHIAQHGYTHENVHVFFPLVPLLIRGVTFITHKLLPELGRLAPVSLYMTMINVAASGLAAIFLRRLSLLTFLGPEAHDLVAGVPQRRTGHQCGAAVSNSSAESVRAVLCVAVRDRLEHRKNATMLDACPDTKATAAESGRLSDPASVEMFTWRIVGAAVLLWTVTPSMVFTVAVYTESCFSLCTFAGVYLLARYPSAPNGTGAQLYPFPDDSSKEVQAEGPRIEWKQAYLSTDEAAAVVCFTVAALSRSNAFLCSGFLLYPTFIRLFCPRLHKFRWSCIHGHYALPQPSTEGGRRGTSATAHGAVASAASVKVVRTLHPPHGRLPKPLRLMVLTLEVALMMTPYFVMNYRGWKTYVPLWAPEDRAEIGLRFWRFYSILQRKYWNVGFLTAYTVVNSPNVAIGAPSGLVILYCVYKFYLHGNGLCSLARHRQKASGKGRARRIEGNYTTLSTLSDYLEALVRSSNVVYLLFLVGVAYTIMHIQVANRFLMSCPALYWLTAMQLVSRPRTRFSRAILLFSVMWALVGGLLFPNHLPWT